MTPKIQDLFDARARAQFETLIQEVTDLAESGRIDLAMNKIRSGAQIVRSMPLTASFFDALPAVSNQALASFFSNASCTSALGSPVLAFSGSHGLYCRCGGCSFGNFIAWLAPILAKAAVLGTIATVLFLFEAPAVAIGVICFMILVCWVVYEGQQPPRVALQSNPAFVARLQQEMASIEREVRSCGVLS